MRLKELASWLFFGAFWGNAFANSKKYDIITIEAHVINPKKGVVWKMKIAIIGCGTIANAAHIPSYLNNDEAEIKYFCDIIPERA